MTTQPRPFGRSAQAHRPRIAEPAENTQECCCCGRDVELLKVRHWVHVVNGGARYGGAEDDADVAGDMGWFPVGTSCARRLKKLGVHVHEDDGALGREVANYKHPSSAGGGS